MKISASQLSTQLSKKLSPCYLVSGDEPLLVQEALDAIRESARTQGFTARESHIATTGFDWNELAGAGSNLSLFAERRVIDLVLPTGKPGVKGAAAIISLLEQTADDLMLIVSTPKLDKSSGNSKWARALDSSGIVVQVWPVSNRELPAWVETRMQAAGLVPDREAVALIADRVEGNLLAAMQEIEKLRLLHGRGPITAEEANVAVADSSRYDVYKLVDAAVAGNVARALRILHGVKSEGTDAVIVVWALTRELRMLAGLANLVCTGTPAGAAMQKARVWRNRQGLVRSCISRHQAADFYRLLQLCRQADAAAKGQAAGDPWQIATQIVVALANGIARAA